MKMRPTLLVLLFWFLPGLLLAGLFVLMRVGSFSPSRGEVEQGLDRLRKVHDLIKSAYVEEVDSETLFRGALNGMVEALDPHSQFLTEDLYSTLEVETTGKFGGLGIEVTMVDGQLTVITPLEGTPAYRAGISPGDSIMEIDGESTEGMTLMEAVKRMRGEAGTTVEIVVIHEGEDEPVKLAIVREVIELKSVKGGRFVDEKLGIAYLRLASFQEDTSCELRDSVDKLLSEEMRGLVLDLRFNSGGLLEQSVEVADLFLEKGTIVTMKGRIHEHVRVYEAQEKGTFPDFALVVLVNGYSASASEIVAGAIQDHARGILMGTRTYGKGSVQRIFPMPDGRSGVRLTTAKYFTPSGKSIHREKGKKEYGLEPDMVVGMDRASEMELFRAMGREEILQPRDNDGSAHEPAEVRIADPQLDRAIELLREKLASQ